MKKIPFNELTLEKLKWDRDDDPLIDFPLLKMRAFVMCSLKTLTVTINEARGCSKEHGNVDAITASFKRGWDVGQCPFPYMIIDNKKQLIDRRHSKSAAQSLFIEKVPAIEYIRVKDSKWDFLSDESVLILAAVRFNVDGTTNAKKEHFQHAVLTVCKKEGLKNTDKTLVDDLLDIMGINERYSHQQPITEIKNKILDHTDIVNIGTTKNSTDEEFEEVLDKLPEFGQNQTDKYGTILHTMVSDKKFNKRYAWDLLRHLLEAEREGKNIRILVRSKATTTRGVMEDRDDLLNKVVEYCNLSYDSYRTFASELLNDSKPSYISGDIELPIKGVENLPGEVYTLHQLEDEEEPKLVDFLDYYPKLNVVI
jgi:hypothetical protein